MGEIHDNQKKVEEHCPVGDAGEWWHIQGDKNPADRPTRLDTRPVDIKYGSTWQKGEAFLCLPRNKWHFDRSFAEKGKGQVTIPRMEVNKKYRDMIQGEVYASTISMSELEQVVLSHKNLSPNSSCIDPKLSSIVPPTSPENTEWCMSTEVEGKELGPEHPDNPIVKRFLGGHITNSWRVLLKKTMVYFPRVAKILRNRTGDESISAYHLAMKFWFKQAMPATWKAFNDRKLDKLTVWEKDGMLMVTGRAMEGLKHYFGVDYLPVLKSSSRLAELILMKAHN